MEPGLLWQGPLHAFFHWWGLQTTSHFSKDLKDARDRGACPRSWSTIALPRRRQLQAVLASQTRLA